MNKELFLALHDKHGDVWHEDISITNWHEAMY
jgi:hypothetical protein